MAILLVLLAMACLVAAFAIYSNNKKVSLLSTPEVQAKLTLAQEFLKITEEYKKEYFPNSRKEALKEKYREAFRELSKSRYKSFRHIIIDDFIHNYGHLDKLVKAWNRHFVEKELERNAALFDDIDGKVLDEQQRQAVVTDEDNNLILAGAGSGKTLTVSAKVKYLVDRKNVSPEEILLISFTKKAADEMQERISHKLNINVEAKTFHKLGLDIISQAKGRRPEIFQGLPAVTDNYFDEVILRDKKAIRNLITFFGSYLNVPKDPEEFDSPGEAHDHNRHLDMETLKSKIETLKSSRVTMQGESVKSLEEVMIANHLYLNGVNYTYEKEYPYKSDDPFRKRYRPDFYLDDYDIYLEHFGVTEDEKVPWLREVEEEKYLDGMRWKRETHKKHGTRLVETYSYYHKKGSLYAELDKILKEHGVIYRNVDHRSIYELLFKDEGHFFREFKKLIQSFIGLFKARGYTEEDFNTLNQITFKIKNLFLRTRATLFMYIIKPVFVQYQNVLDSTGQVDFNDMINLAADIVQKGNLEFNLKYIIIDEYQDISVGRFNLIKQLKDRTNARIMAVGDDWQSIYRFTGSDLGMFTNFDKYFGYSEISRIEKTYRNSQELIEMAGKFIMKNPRQLQKNLKSDKRNSNPVRVLGYNRDLGLALKEAIGEIVSQYGEDAEIMILGRNNFDIDALNGSREFKIIKNTRGVTVRYNLYPNLRMFFLTTHRSKGLEADNVIVINLENKLLGFPNKISDDPLLSLVLTNPDRYDFAEERRLFYVAITRTRNITYLLVPDKNMSAFAEELIRMFHIPYSTSNGEASVRNNPACPVCRKGRLVVRVNQEGGSRFLGCTNYPLCEGKINNIEVLKNPIVCNSCGGYMVKKKGPYGQFYGCTNYPWCRHKHKNQSGGE